MTIYVGDLVIPIGKSVVVADYDIDDNTILLLTEFNSVIKYPARADPFYLEPCPVFAVPYEEIMGDRGQVHHYEKNGTKYEMILSGSFETDGKYFLQPLTGPEGIQIGYATPYAYTKPEDFYSWVQVEINTDVFISKVTRLFSSNLGTNVYYDNVPDDLHRTAEAALSTSEGFMWWAPLIQIQKI